jgi:hypothetical protein
MTTTIERPAAVCTGSGMLALLWSGAVFCPVCVARVEAFHGRVAEHPAKAPA